MDFGWDDNARFCHLRSIVLRQAIADGRVLDALLGQLDVPAKSAASLKALPTDAKFRAIEQQIDHLRRAPTSLWHDAKPAEVLAAEIFRADLPFKLVRDGYFQGVARESDLLPPVATWLRGRKRVPYAEVPLGPNHADLLGYRSDWWETHFVAVELKNMLAELTRALDQATTYAAYAHQVYLACTPALAAAYLWRHANGKAVTRWDSQAFDRKLKTAGVGLLLVEGQVVFEVRSPRSNDPAASKIDEVKRVVAGATPLTA